MESSKDHAHSKGISILLILIIVLIVAVVGIFGYWFYLRFFSSGIMLLNKPTPTAVPALVATPTPIAWLSYSDNNFSFQFAPGSATFSNNTGVQINYWGPKQSKPSPGSTNNLLSDGYVIGIINQGPADTTNIPALVQNNRQNPITTCNSANISDTSTIILGGKTASTYKITCPGFVDEEYFVSNGKNVYEISNYYVGDTQSLALYKQTTSYVLSTFKFNQ